MLGNSFNLVDMIRGQLTGDVIGRIASLLGESNDRTRSAISVAIPQLLAGLGSASTTTDGARRINSAIDASDDVILSNLMGMFGKGFTSESGTGILQSILGGGGLSGLTSSIGRVSGLPGKTAVSLLGMLAPLIFGVLKNVKRTTGPDFDVASLLASQRENIAAAMPLDTLEETYAGSSVASGERVVETYTEAPRRETHGWVLPLVLLAGALGLVGYWMMGRPHDTSFLPPSSVHAGGEAPDTGHLAMRSFDELKTRYDSVLREAKSLGVEISDLRQDGDKLMITGMAPTLDAANRVWDEIKRVNPAVDDITAYIPVEPGSSETQPATGGTREKPSANQEPAATSEPAAGEMYTVQRGDTLGSISRHFYGSTKDYMRIFNANREKLNNKDLIEVGQELSIP